RRAGADAAPDADLVLRADTGRWRGHLRRRHHPNAVADRADARRGGVQGRGIATGAVDPLPAKPDRAPRRGTAGAEALHGGLVLAAVVAVREPVDAVGLRRRDRLQLLHRATPVTLRVLHLIYDDPENPWVGGGGAVRV